MILALLACSSGPPDVAPEAAFGSPAEAEDLDPADDVVQVALMAAPLVVEEVEGEAADEEHDEAKSAGHDEEATTAAPSGYAYNGQVPGPTIRAKVGDTVIVDLTNALDVATTIHWHGLVLPADMDGVTWMTDPLEPGQTFRYQFTLDRAGTYWYHPHLDVKAQVESGLYGAFVVEDPEEPVAEQELVVVWQATSGGTASHNTGGHDEDTGEHDDSGAEAKEGDHDHAAHEVNDPADLSWTANGQVLPTFTWGSDERVRVRMINAAARGYLDLSWPAMRHIGGDQGLYAAEAAPESVVLAPGDRADFEWTGAGFTVENALYTESGGAALGLSTPVLEAVGDAAADPIAWPFSGELPSIDPGATAITYMLTGGGDGTWLINGESYPDVTVETLVLGDESVIEVRNLSPSEHPFHVHGHRFEVLSVDGIAPAALTVEDTLNIPIRGRVRLKLLPTHAGEWMVHCHILTHEENGMMTVLRVE